MSTAAKAFLTVSQSARMERILTTTLRLIGEVGAERMTMRDIAAASQVSAATLYNRFGTKDNLVTIAVVEKFERSIRSVVAAHALDKTPLEKIIYGLEVLAADILRSQMFAHAMIATFFKLDNDRQMPDQLLAAVRNTWRPAIEEMKKNRALRDWASVPLLVEEISDRTLAVVMRWAQQGFPRAELGHRLVYAVVSSVSAATRGKQALEAESILANLSKKIRVASSPS